MKVTRIKNPKIKFISLCPRGANRMHVFMKSEDLLAARVLLSKVNPKGELIACVYAPGQVDAQNDWASAEDIQEMARSYMRAGAMLDVMHDGQALSKDDAYVAESFVIQKGDPRFADLKDEDGKQVDPAGGWGVVIQLVRDDLKKLYTDGGWAGVSMGGVGVRTPESPPISKESDMTDEQIKALAKSITDGILAGLKPQEAPAPPKPKFDPLDKKAVAARKAELLKAKLSEGIDFDDPASIAEFEARVEKFEEEQKLAKASGQPAGTQPPAGGPNADPSDPLTKGVTLGSSLAKVMNARRGFVAQA